MTALNTMPCFLVRTYIRTRVSPWLLVKPYVLPSCFASQHASYTFVVLTRCIDSATVVLSVLLPLIPQEEVKEEARSSAQDKVDKFLASQGSILSKPIDPFKANGEGEVGWRVVGEEDVGTARRDVCGRKRQAREGQVGEHSVVWLLCQLNCAFIP